MSWAEVPATTWVLLCGAALLAGFIDSVVGGGGLIQIPALLAGFPGLPPATLLGSNKIASIVGTSMAAWQYGRRIALPWNALGPAIAAALLFAWAGAYTVTQIPPDFLRAALPFILLGVAVYIFTKKTLGVEHLPRQHGRREQIYGAAAGAGVGFYDGFFGPGTGSFLVFIFVRVFGFDFLRASAAAKLVNVACNFAALAWFISAGHVWWTLGLTMAVFNMAGAVAGSRLALRRGAVFVRTIFLAVVTLLIIKTSYDSFLG